MKKIKLYCIGNSEYFNYYIFDKKQWVIEILSKIIFDIFKLNLDLHKEFFNKKHLVKKINFEKIKDEHESIDTMGKKNRGDIFYGDKKIFLTIHCSQKLRLKFNNELGRIGLMPKAKKFKPIEK